MRERKASQGLLLIIQNVKRRICLKQRCLYRCLKLQQEACIRKLVHDCNDDDVFAVLPTCCESFNRVHRSAHNSLNV